MSGKASFLIAAGFVVAALAAVFLLGPRVTVNAKSRALPAIPDDPLALESWLRESEAAFDDVVEGAEKNIVWADPASRAKTDYVVLYLHGFSATRQELSPIPQKVAAHFNANLYLPRIEGHGRGSSALSASTAEQWLDGTWQAWHVARRLGDKAIVMGTSTGATLAAWLIGQEGVKERTRALVFVSPNFGLKNGASPLLTYPWSTIWVPWILGREYAWEPKNALQSKYWTTRYSVKTLQQVQALVDWFDRQDYSRIGLPALFIYSHYDQVVNPDRIGEIFQQWGGRKERMVIEYLENSSNHVIAGDILAPQNNAPIIDRIAAFVDEINGVAARPSPKSGPWPTRAPLTGK